MKQSEIDKEAESMRRAGEYLYRSQYCTRSFRPPFDEVRWNEKVDAWLGWRKSASQGSD